jgi:hypothetical protein
MQGPTGTYAFNGTSLLLMPTEAGWVSKELIGISGNGHPTYPGVREFEMNWDYMAMDEFAQIQTLFDGVHSTGSLVVDLPKYGTTPYTFYSYSGCTLKEPEVGNFYETYVTKVRLLILRIR